MKNDAHGAIRESRVQVFFPINYTSIDPKQLQTDFGTPYLHPKSKLFHQ